MEAGGGTVEGPPTGAEVRAAREATDRLTTVLEETLDRVYVPREEFEAREIKAEEHRRNVRVALWGLAVFTTLLLVLAVIQLAGYIRLGDLAESNKERIATNQAVIDEIQECIAPAPPAAGDPHECYDRGQASQEEAIERLLDGFSDEIDRVIDEIRAVP